MKHWMCCLHLILSIMLCSQSRVKCSTVDPYNINISNTSSSIKVAWRNPDKTKSDLCYRTHLQYRNSCGSFWQNYTDLQSFFLELPALDMKKNYVFRIRMQLYCIQQNWGEWSPEKYWKNNTGPCIAATLPFSIKNYVLLAILPVAGFLLVCAITQERVRRFVLPIIPDPTKVQNRILDIETFQHMSSLTQTWEEFKISEIEVYYEKEDEPTEPTDSRCDDQSSQTQPTHTVYGNNDIGLATNNSMYYIYSSDASESNMFSNVSHSTTGYIVI